MNGRQRDRLNNLLFLLMITVFYGVVSEISVIQWPHDIGLCSENGGKLYWTGGYRAVCSNAWWHNPMWTIQSISILFFYVFTFFHIPLLMFSLSGIVFEQLQAYLYNNSIT